MKDGFWFQAGRDDTIGKESGVCVCVCSPLRSTSHNTQGLGPFPSLAVERRTIYEGILFFPKYRQQFSNNTRMARGEDKQLSCIIIVETPLYGVSKKERNCRKKKKKKKKWCSNSFGFFVISKMT